MLGPDSKKIIFKLFDRKKSGEKRPHTCSTCSIYKREIAKGNREAFEFYKLHIMEVAKRNDGVTFVLYGKTKNGILANCISQKNSKP
jgi:hypothetical protein